MTVILGGPDEGWQSYNNLFAHSDLFTSMMHVSGDRPQDGTNSWYGKSNKPGYCIASNHGPGVYFFPATFHPGQ